MRRLRLLLLGLSGCAHWGTTNVVERVPDPPSVVSTYLAPVRTALRADSSVAVTKEPPPPGSTVLAVAKARCASDEDDCLQALSDEARRIGGNGLFGVHEENTPRVGTYLVGSIALDERAAPPTPSGRTTRVDWSPSPADRNLDVVLERRDPRDEIPFWRPVCKLPCTADLDRDQSYRLEAPALAGEPPLELEAATARDRVRVTTRVGKPSFGRFWWGLGTTLVAGGAMGGTTAYYVANHGSPSGVAELTVGLSLLPCLFVGLEEMLLGPVNRVELALEPDG